MAAPMNTLGSTGTPAPGPKAITPNVHPLNVICPTKKPPEMGAFRCYGNFRTMGWLLVSAPAHR